MLRKQVNSFSYPVKFLHRHHTTTNLINHGHITVHSHEEKIMQKQILQNHLGLSYQKIAALVRNNKYLLTVNNRRLSETLKTLDQMGFEKEDIFKNPTTLSIHSNTIKHNVMYLKEAGFSHISANILINYRPIVKKPIYLLKAHNFIPDDTDVAKRLYSFLTPKPASFPILKQFTDDDSIIHIHGTIVKEYLVWRLETTASDVERILKIYERFRYRSLQLISRMIKLLSKTLGYTPKKILSHGYLLHINPEFVKEVMVKFPKLAGVDIKKVFNKCTKLVSVPPSHYEAIYKYLKDDDISDEAIQNCFEIFTLSPDSVLYRLNEMKKVPEFQALKKNNRVVRLLYCQNKAKLRLEHLQQINVKCASLNVLCASDSVFERYITEGNDRTKGYDLLQYLSLELKQPITEIREKLNQNMHWYHVPLITVRYSLKFLLRRTFLIDDISKLPILLLYPREKLQRGLQEIYQNPDTRHAKLTPRQQLNLCLYFIERTHHFSGDGVWQNGLTTPKLELEPEST